MDQMVAAFAERKLEQFVLIPTKLKTTKKIVIGGEISNISKDQKSVIIRILYSNCIEVVQRLLEESFDLLFQVNRLPYQLQHQALDFIQKDKLFDVLINNDNYSRSCNGVNASNLRDNHKFK